MLVEWYNRRQAIHNAINTVLDLKPTEEELQTIITQLQKEAVTGV